MSKGIPRLEVTKEGIPLREILYAIERLALVDALMMTGGLQGQAGKLLGLKPRDMTYKIRKFEINAKAIRQQAKAPERRIHAHHTSVGGFP